MHFILVHHITSANRSKAHRRFSASQCGAGTWFSAHHLNLLTRASPLSLCCCCSIRHNVFLWKPRMTTQSCRHWHPGWPSLLQSQKGGAINTPCGWLAGFSKRSGDCNRRSQTLRAIPVHFWAQAVATWSNLLVHF